MKKKKEGYQIASLNDGDPVFWLFRSNLQAHKSIQVRCTTVLKVFDGYCEFWEEIHWLSPWPYFMTLKYTPPHTHTVP